MALRYNLYLLWKQKYVKVDYSLQHISTMNIEYFKSDMSRVLLDQLFCNFSLFMCLHL